MDKNIKKNNSNKNSIKTLTLLLIVLSLLIALCFFFIEYSNIISNSDDINEPIIAEPIVEKTNEPAIKIDIDKYQKIFEENKSINDDYAGQIVFESGLIDEPFTFSFDNADYLRTDFYTGMYSILGTVFMDFESTFNSQNIVLYGHTVYSIYDAGYDESGNKIDNDSLMFTPLKFLEEKEFYEQNKTIWLVLSNQVREYEIVSVFYCPLDYYDGYYYTNENLMYNLPEYDNSYLKTYKKAIKDAEFFKTGIDFTNNDKLLTLQTCVENHEELRLIVLCKEINRMSY